MKYRLAILIPYFGPWPAWIDFFLESCRPNAHVQWYLFSDNDPPENRVPNVRHVRISFDDYKSLVSDALGIRFNPSNPYKLCDLKPALPFVHRDLVEGYDFVGFGDLDIIYGNLRQFHDDQILGAYDLLSTHADRVSGHLFMMRNEKRLIAGFKRIRGWEKIFEQQAHAGFDERQFYNLYRGRRAQVASWLGDKPPRCFFREAYSTPGPKADMRWYWKDGELTNQHFPHHPFMYLHFMNWHSSRWYADEPDTDANAHAPWSELREVVQMNWRDARRDGFCISRKGIEPLEPPR